MSTIGWYYLHVNGDLIYKPDYDSIVADIRDSDLARGMWPLDPTIREGAWRIVVEGLAAGARPERIAALAKLWQCDDDDAQQYAERIGVNLFKDGTAWCATRKDFDNSQESPAGFGDKAYEAFAALAHALDYRPSKMWGATFADLCKVKETA